MAGREIRYVDLPAAAFTDRLAALGLPARFADDVATLFAGAASGSLAPTTTAVADLTGRPPRTFDDVLSGEAEAVRRAWAAP